MKKLLFLFIYLIFLQQIGFSQIHSGSDSLIEKIMIDPSNGEGGTASQIYDEVNYIPLETTKESLFGEISQLQITDKYFIVLDKSTDAILFFNKDGSYHHKINKFSFDENYIHRIESAEGVRAGSILNTFSVDPIKQQIYVTNSMIAKYLYIFSFEGKRIGKLGLPPYTQDYFFLKDGTQCYKQFRPHSSSKLSDYQPSDVLLTKDSGVIKKHLFSLDFKQAAFADDMPMHINYFNSAGNPDQCFYTPDLDYNVYELNSTGIRHQYQFLFPMQYSLPANFGYDSMYTNKRREFLKDKSLITSIFGFNKLDNYLILDIRIQNSSNSNYKLLYSLKTTQLLLLDRISSDVKSYYLPIKYAGILACDNKSYFISIPSLNMFYANEETADKHPKYNTILENYFKTQNRKSNPVIVQLKLKDNL